MGNIESEYMEFCEYQQPIVKSWQRFFFFSCSCVFPLFFYISLFYWLEEDKAEKQDAKVNTWNAVALKNHFLFFLR